MDKLLLKIPEAANRVSLGKTKFYSLVQSGDIRSVRIGRSVRIPADALREWIEKRAEEDERW